MKTLFDKSKVTHIIIRDLIKSNYIWCEEIKEKRVFFNIFLSEVGSEDGYYKNKIRSWIYRVDKVEEGSIDIDGVLHWLPHVKVYINKECVGLKYFNKLEESVAWCSKEFENVNYSVS